MKPANPHGWTENEAIRRATLRQLYERDMRSAFLTLPAFDLLWGEWVVVSNHPSLSATITRKPRRGLRRSQTYRNL